MDPMIGKKIEPYEIQEILALLETPDGICIVGVRNLGGEQTQRCGGNLVCDKQERLMQAL